MGGGERNGDRAEDKNLVFNRCELDGEWEG